MYIMASVHFQFVESIVEVTTEVSYECNRGSLNSTALVDENKKYRTSEAFKKFLTAQVNMCYSKKKRKQSMAKTNAHQLSLAWLFFVGENRKKTSREQDGFILTIVLL